MKVKESGMPNQKMWESFFKPEETLKALSLDHAVRDVVEFGCGYGTFTIPAGKIVTGKVYAIDIDSKMIEITRRKTVENKLNNIETILRDFIQDGSGLSDESVDYAMLFNILHLEKPEMLLREAYRILQRGGKIGIMHWNYDPTTPRGPSMEIRPKPQQCVAWAMKAGFIDPQQYDLKPYHYGIVLKKGNG